MWESCAIAFASPSIYLIQTEALSNEHDDKRSQPKTMIIDRRDDAAYERIGLADNLQLGALEEYFGPRTEITLC